MVKKVLATKELVVSIGGVVYDALLIPRERLVDIDYSNCPEDDPRREKKRKKKDR